MHEVEIEVVQSQIAESFVQGLFYAIRGNVAIDF